MNHILMHIVGNRPQFIKLEAVSRELLRRSYVMYNAFCYYKDKADSEAVLEKYGVKNREYILMTWHRQENTSNIDRMSQILSLAEKIKRPILCLMHPRTYGRLKEYQLLERAIKIVDLMENYLKEMHV